jgi:hypothetical protein
MDYIHRNALLYAALEMGSTIRQDFKLYELHVALRSLLFVPSYRAFPQNDVNLPTEW